MRGKIGNSSPPAAGRAHAEVADWARFVLACVDFATAEARLGVCEATWRGWRTAQEAKTWVHVPLQEKFHWGTLKGVRNVSDAL